MPESSKTCIKCNLPKDLEAFAHSQSSRDGRRQPCKDCRNHATRKARAANAEGERAKEAAYRAENREHIRKYARDYAAETYASNPEKFAAASQRSYQKLKNEVLTHYGSSCACCGSTIQLSIDHINGDGAEHREELFGNPRYGGGSGIYTWLRLNDFPPGFQILCKRCNRSKGTGTYCSLHDKQLA